jgi:unsaturated rhamnogalacturonyl hydrolase
MMVVAVSSFRRWTPFAASYVRGYRSAIVVFGLTVFLGAGCLSSFAQTAPASPATAKVVPVDGSAAGDAPDNPGPLATGLSSELKPKAIAAAMKKVADWQVAYVEPKFNQQWTFAALYDGLLAASATTGDPKYRDAVLHLAERSDWKLLDARFPHADDQALGQAYLDLYRADPPAARQAVRLANTQEIMDRLIVRPDDPDKLLWWWCDALFMAPPVWARMYAATGDRKYISYLDEEWAKTSDLLYSKEDHLYARDVTYLTKTEANGKRMYWARGEGWVMGGLARTLEYLPKDDARREFYVNQLKEMSAALAAVQGKDGLWRAGVLDQASYSEPEVSGSALITFGLAWGVNEGVLDAKVYRPVIEKAWAGMLKHVYADGRLGSIQQTGAEPAPFKPTASYTYGVGGFLLAGSEVRRLGMGKSGMHKGAGVQ